MYKWRKIKDLDIINYEFLNILCSDKGDRALTVGDSETLSKSSYIVISDNYGNIDSFKGTLNQDTDDANIYPVMSGDGNVMGFVNDSFVSTKFNLYRIDYKSKSVKAVNHAKGTRWNGIASNYKGDKIILSEYNKIYYLMQNKSLKI